MIRLDMVAKPLLLGWRLVSPALFLLSACFAFWEDVHAGRPWWTSSGIGALLLAASFAIALGQPFSGPRWRRYALTAAQLFPAFCALAWLFIRRSLLPPHP